MRGMIIAMTPISSQRNSQRKTPAEFDENNQQKESFGQLVWYFALVDHTKKLRELPLDQWHQPRFELGGFQTILRVHEFLRAVQRGHVTKTTFPEYVPDGDHRPELVDTIWLHVERIFDELKLVRQCITQTMEHLIEKNRLDDTVTDFISPGPVQETWMSDLLINEELKRKIVDDNVPDEEKDWHPESNNQMLDLVHPSLYCCVFGETKCVVRDSSNDDGNHTTAADRMQRMIFGASHLVENPHRGSTKYQWIPSEFDVTENGEVQIRSCINNLHPVQHREMYNSIAEIFKAFAPMFDRALSCLLNPQGPEPVLKYPDSVYEIYDVPHHPLLPETVDLEPQGPPFTLRGKSIQVIVKIAEIHLSPEKPYFPNGSWHVEGSDAEQIVATGIYYFGFENIAASRLMFRVMVQEPYAQQDDTLGMKAMYGLGRGERLIQHVGQSSRSRTTVSCFPTRYSTA